MNLDCCDCEDYDANKEYCDNLYSELEEERERDKAGDHWLGGVTPDEFVDADKESDLGYNALCEYNRVNGIILIVNSMMRRKKRNMRIN